MDTLIQTQDQDKIMFNRKTVNIPIYHGKLDICITDDRERMAKDYKDVGGFNDEVFAHTLYNESKGVFAVVLNPLNSISKLSQGIIAHEAVHVVNFVFGSRGVIPDTDNDEPMAYFVEWVVDEINKYLQSLKIDVK